MRIPVGVCGKLALMISRRAFATLAIGVVIAASGCSAQSSTIEAANKEVSAAETGAKLPDTLDAKSFADLIAEPDVVVVDVRTPEEFASGHIEDALLINIGSPDFAEQIGKLDQSKTYALYCRSGNRSGQALSAMRKAGFGNVHHLGGGIGAWQANGGEVVTE